MGREDSEPELDIISESTSTSPHMDNVRNSLKDKNNELQKKIDELSDSISQLQSNQNLDDTERGRLQDEVNDLQSSIDTLTNEISLLESYTEDTQHKGDFVDDTTFYTREEQLQAERQRMIDEGETEEIANMWYRDESAQEEGRSGGMTGSADDVYVPTEFYNRMRQAREGRLNYLKGQLEEEQNKDSPNQTRLGAINDLITEAQKEVDEMFGTLDTPKKFYATDYDVDGNEIPTNASRRGRDGKAGMSKEEQDLHDSLESSQKDLTDAQGHNEVLENQLENKQDMIDDLNAQIEDLTNKGTDDDVVIQHLKDELASAQNDLSELQTAKNLSDTNLSNAQNSLSQSQSNLQSALGEVGERGDKINELREELNIIRGDYGLDNTINDPESSTNMNELQQLISSQELDLMNTKAELARALAQDATDKDTIGELNDRINDLEGNEIGAGNTIPADTQQRPDTDKDDDGLPDVDEDDDGDGIPDGRQPPSGQSWEDTINGAKAQQDLHDAELAKWAESLAHHQNEVLYSGHESLGVVKTEFFKSALGEIGKLGIQKVKEIYPLSKPFIELAEQADGKFGFSKKINDGAYKLTESCFTAIKDNVVGKKEPFRIQIGDIKQDEESFISKPFILPFAVLALHFYLAHFKNQLSVDIGLGASVCLNGLLSAIYGAGDKRAIYLLFLIDNLPKELLEMYIKNREMISLESFDREIPIVDKYLKEIQSKYKELFNKELKEDLNKHEDGGQSNFLYNLLMSVKHPRTLHEIANMLRGVDRLLGMFGEDKGLFFGLMSLLFQELQHEDFNNERKVMSSKIQGIVYYKKKRRDLGEKLSNEYQVLKGMENRQGGRKLEGFEIIDESETNILYLKDDIYYLGIVGTDIYDKDFKSKDFLENLFNLGGSPELFTNEKYNRRYKNGYRMIEKAVNLIRQGKGQNIKVQGYSLGSISTIALASIFKDIQFQIFNPIVIKTPLMDKIMQQVEKNNNLKVNYVETDPISSQVKKYLKNIKSKTYKKSKYYHAHHSSNFRGKI